MESTGELKIQEIDGKECVLVTLKKIATTKPVTVAFYDTVNKAMLSTTMTINVASDADVVYKTDLKESLPGYEIIDNGKNQISENNRVVMSVKPVAAEKMRNVTVTYRYEGSNKVITKATVDVPMSKKVLTKAELRVQPLRAAVICLMLFLLRMARSASMIWAVARAKLLLLQRSRCTNNLSWLLQLKN